MDVKKTEVDTGFVKKWSSRGVSPVLASIMYRRAIVDDLQVFSFLKSSLGMLNSPFLFDNLPIAYERIQKAIANNEKIYLFGDRDVDGVTSIHVMSTFLRRLGADFQWSLPVGDDPYGLTMVRAEEIESCSTLLITVDCGITNRDEINYLKSKGIDTIVIDHHQPTEGIPEALVIVNPKHQYHGDETDMAACVVATYFVMGYDFYTSPRYGCVDAIVYQGQKHYFCNLQPIDEYQVHVVNSETTINASVVPFATERINPEVETFAVLDHYRKSVIESLPELKENLYDNLTFAALATLSDIMPLSQINNRTVLSLGIALMRTKPPKALSYLFNRNKIDKDLLSVTDISWKVTPILNSAGRMGDARVAVDYLDENCVDSLDANFEKIHAMNELRKRQGEEGVNLFCDDIDENLKRYGGYLNFFHSDKIGRGVLGITASKLSEKSGLPVIVGQTDSEYLIGSIRGNTDMHLVEFLSGASSVLEEYGGHRCAAGFRFKLAELDSFDSYLRENSYRLFAEEHSKRDESHAIDAVIPAQYLSTALYRELEHLQPYGEQNPTPLLYSEQMRVQSYFCMGREREHLKLVFETSNSVMSAVFWRKASWFVKQHKDGDCYNILYKMELNSYKDSVNIQLNIVDMEKAQ